MPVTLQYNADHVLVRLEGAAALSALRQTILVPYSDVRDVVVETPRWPPALAFRVGTHLPRVIVSGGFYSWKLDHKRFLHFSRKDERVLTLRLSGHPQFDEISVALAQPDAARREIEQKRARK